MQQVTTIHIAKTVSRFLKRSMLFWSRVLKRYKQIQDAHSNTFTKVALHANYTVADVYKEPSLTSESTLRVTFLHLMSVEKVSQFLKRLEY